MLKSNQISVLKVFLMKSYQSQSMSSNEKPGQTNFMGGGPYCNSREPSSLRTRRLKERIGKLFRTKEVHKWRTELELS